MLSVNTNPGALTALRAFNAVNRDLDVVGARISTGLKVVGAADNASNFAIAQGLRSEVKAWQAVRQSLGTGVGPVRLAVAGATAISDLQADLKVKVVQYFNADTQSQAIIQNDIDALLNQIDQIANGATFGSRNLINVDQATTPFTPPADQGTTFTFNGPGSNTHALGTTSGTVTVGFAVTGSGGGNFRLIYDGNVVANTSAGAPSTGVLTFAYPATPVTDFTVQKVGSPNADVDYSFTLTPDNAGTALGDYKVISSIDGDQIDVQSRSMLAVDLSLRPINLSNIGTALGQLDAAELEINQNLGYYGAKLREFNLASDNTDLFVDAVSEGLGNIVDADLGRESAKLLAIQARQQLSLDTLAIATRAPQFLLSLFA